MQKKTARGHPLLPLRWNNYKRWSARPVWLFFFCEKPSSRPALFGFSARPSMAKRSGGQPFGALCLGRALLVGFRP